MLKTLEGMGFTKAIASRALQETRNAGAEEAMACILDNQDKWEAETSASSDHPLFAAAASTPAASSAVCATFAAISPLSLLFAALCLLFIYHTPMFGFILSSLYGRVLAPGALSLTSTLDVNTTITTVPARPNGPNRQDSRAHLQEVMVEVPTRNSCRHWPCLREKRKRGNPERQVSADPPLLSPHSVSLLLTACTITCKKPPLTNLCIQGGSYGGGGGGGGSQGIKTYRVVHPLGVGYRRSPLLSDKILERKGPSKDDMVKGGSKSWGTDGLEYVKCDNGFYLPVSIFDSAAGGLVQVLQEAGEALGNGDGNMDEAKMMRLAMEMSLAESGGGGGGGYPNPSQSYSQPSYGRSDDPEDAALKAALAASMADAPSSGSTGGGGGYTRSTPATVDWIPGAPPPPMAAPEAPLAHRRPAPVAAPPPSQAPNPHLSALDAQLESTLQPIVAPTMRPMPPQWAQMPSIAPTAAPQPPVTAPPGGLASLVETSASDWAAPGQMTAAQPLAPPLSRQTSLDGPSPSSRDKILADREHHHQQPAYMQLGANLAALQAGQAAHSAAAPPVQVNTMAPTGYNPSAVPAAYPGFAAPVTAAPVVQAAPVAPVSVWAQPQAATATATPSLESDFERTIRLIEEANQERAAGR